MNNTFSLICVCILVAVSGLAIGQIISNKVVEDNKTVFPLYDCSYVDQDTEQIHKIYSAKPCDWSLNK